MNDYVSLNGIKESFNSFKSSTPFNHCVVKNFLDSSFALDIESEFLDYESDKWFFYQNEIEHKKALNDWNMFPANTYSLFSYLNSPEFIDFISNLYGKKLYADPGLHGGGWHIHGSGGNLNPHLDYSIHPKLNLQRTLNIIIYLSSQLQPPHGGHLGLWSHDSSNNAPLDLIHEIVPEFNSAVIFDTTQNSWHGMSRPLIQPNGIYRKSLAIYYLCVPEKNADPRGRALFAPRDIQRGRPEIDELIRLRSGIDTAKLVYKRNNQT